MSNMRDLRIEKAVVNIGVGEAGERLLKAQKVLEMLTNQKPIETISKTTSKDLGIRKGMPIGCKVTLRGEKAEDFLRRALWVKNNRLAYYNFDPEGNFSFGVPDYTEFEGMKYDPEIGIFGMDVSVSVKRPGYRVVKRRRKTARLPASHRVTKEEGIEFMREKFGVEVIE
ncbi:MAG: 50S ribosomal protein L5 [Thermoplasmata archaeon]